MSSFLGKIVLKTNLEYGFSNILALSISSILLARYYKSLLIRLSYIAILCYLYFSIGFPYGLFNEVLWELIRSTRHGSVNHRGTHWSLNIAELAITSGCAFIVTFFFPTYVWTNGILISAVALCYPCNDLYHLWLQKRLTNLARLDRKLWKYALLTIESACLAGVRMIDCKATLGLLRAFESACYWLVTWLTPERGDRMADTVFVASIIHRKNPHAKPLFSILHYWMLYRLWFRKIAFFLNPDPPEYKYAPLKDPKDIRVVVLLPRLGFGQICCCMLQGPHMRLLFYEAVSYKWDSMDATETILVDGCQMKVTKSVFEILASYSSLIVPQLLWIDALCIDQDNEAEKSQQVPMMDKIYLNALFTTLFLGRSPLMAQDGPKTTADIPFRYDGVSPKESQTRRYFEDARLATDLLNEFKVLEFALDRRGGMNVYKDYDSFQSHAWRGRQWAALLKMLQHPVFERVWIIQEIAFSPHVEIRLGDEVLDWDLLAGGVQKLEEEKEFCSWLASIHGIDIACIQRSNLSNITRMQRFRQSCRPRGVFDTSYDWLNGWDTGIGKLLSESVFFKATDPRDLIYGVISLCEKPLNVSYKLSVEEVFLHAAKALVQAESFPTLFHLAGVGNRRPNRKLSSWVPDWTAAPKYKGLQSVDGRESPWNRWRKPKSPQELPTRFQPPRSLRMTAIHIDTIEELGPIMFQDTDFPASGATRPGPTSQILLNYQASMSLASNSSLTTDPYPHDTPPCSLYEAVHLTTTLKKAGRYYDDAWQAVLAFVSKSHTPNRDGASAHDVLDTGTATPLMNSASAEDTHPEIATTVSRFSDAIRSYTGARRLFISRRGYIGMCPPYTMEGDMIHVSARGIAVPFLLRRSGDGLKRYRNSPDGKAWRCVFVGECYCHGLKGEDGKWSVGGEGEGTPRDVEIT